MNPRKRKTEDKKSSLDQSQARAKCRQPELVRGGGLTLSKMLSRELGHSNQSNHSNNSQNSKRTRQRGQSTLSVFFNRTNSDNPDNPRNPSPSLNPDPFAFTTNSASIKPNHPNHPNHSNSSMRDSLSNLHRTLASDLSNKSERERAGGRDKSLL